ncbi:MAG TPA: SRPBCC family protein [Chloroflexota bacterium]|nr:SRPBCC family protein [Chloroflexota bacterium]
MPISTCPIAQVAAPLETVWTLLSDPSRYGEWWSARTEGIEPGGAASVGQVIHASTRALWRRWPVVIRVLGVDASRHALVLHTALPLGIGVRNHIVCAALEGANCRLTFG